MNAKTKLEIKKQMIEDKIYKLETDIFHVSYIISEAILTNALVETRKELMKIEKELEQMKNMEQVENINAVGQISELIYNTKHPEEE